MSNTLLKLSFLALYFFITIQNNYATKKITGFSMKLIHRHSPKSPMYRANLTNEERLREHVEISSSRIMSLARLYGTKNISSFKDNHTNNEVIRPIIGYLNHLYYVVVGIGTFNEGSSYKDYYLAFDTGSDLTWTQCEGCAPNCFHQIDPVFPASRSLSYQKFICQNCPTSYGGICENNACTIRRIYGDTSSVVAIPSLETFTLQSEPPNTKMNLFNVLFGCGINQRDFTAGIYRDNILSGILGMGYGDLSFWFKTFHISKGLFSYCLQPLDVIENPGIGKSPMYLRFGHDSVPLPPNMKTTPMSQILGRSMYFLNLQGISIADQRLNVDPSVFQAKPDRSGGCFIDTGAAISYIVSEAFKVMLDVVTNYVEQHNPNLQKLEPPQYGLRLCYKGARGGALNLPSITFHFANDANFVIQPNSAFVKIQLTRSYQAICWPFQESTRAQHNSFTILGVMQQANHRIIVSPMSNQLLFGPDDCSVLN